MMKYIKTKIIDFLKQEGVGDVYLQKKYNIPNEFDDFNRKYSHSEFTNKQSVKNDGIFFTENDWSIIKNPSSLKLFGDSVRGVIVENGDLYLETFSNVIHNDILTILYNKGVLYGSLKRNWTRKLPQETGFLTVQRYKNSKYLAIGESNNILYDRNSYKENIHFYDEFLNKARKKCSGINFVNRLVGTKFLKESNSKENFMNASFL